MTIYDQLQRALSAEGIPGSIQHVLLSLRMRDDSAHVAFQQAASEKEAREWMQTEGRELRPPVAVAYVEGDDAPVQVRRSKVIESSETIPGIGDGANVWRGYGTNTRGVIKFRQGRFVGEVNAPSVKEATAVAKGLVALLTP